MVMTSPAIRKSSGGNDKRAIVNLSKIRRLLFFYGSIIDEASVTFSLGVYGALIKL